MKHLQALLNYQGVDAKLLKLDRELAESEEYKAYRKLYKYIKTAPEKLEALDLKATALASLATQISEEYAQLEMTLAEFEHIDELVENGGDVSFYKKKMQEIGERLRKLKTKALALETDIKDTNTEYVGLKDKIMAAEKPYQVAAKKYKALKETQETARKEIGEKLSALEKEIPPEWLGKYQSKRDSKLSFPIVFEVTNNVCFCGLDVPIANRERLKVGTECDSCHRIIFSE